jgi:muconolactone delta-isomerase
MLFSVRLVSRQPAAMSPDQWQAVVAEQLRSVKSQYQAGKIKSIYRETGAGVLAIYDVADAREMDQTLAQLPMFPYFESVSVHALWDLAPTLEAV